MNKYFGKETVADIKNFDISNHKLQKEFIIAYRHCRNCCFW